jgi:hypothetical protein
MATQITNRQIRDEAINDAKVRSDAAIAISKIAVAQGNLVVGGEFNVAGELTLNPGQLVLGDASGYALAATLSGAATIDATGAILLEALSTDETASVYRGVLVPSTAQAADNTLFLRSDNTWVAPAGLDYTDVFGEVPAQSPDSSQTAFTFANSILADTERVYINGMRMNRAVDYSVSAAVITFTVAPETGDILFADYRY